jgi:hypothetical protein
VTDTFEVQVGIYDNSGTTLITRSTFPITLGLDTTGTMTGTKTGTTSSGLLTLSNLQITTYGTFKIQASSSGLTTGESSTLYIRNLYSITLSASTSPYSANKDFTVTATLKDNFGNAWTQSTTVVLEGSNLSATSSSSLTQTTSTGTATFAVYCSAVGTLALTAKSGTVTGTLSVSIAENVIRVTLVSTVITKQPSLVTDTFSVKVEIYDSSDTTLVTRGSYSVTISLDPSETLSGTLTGTTSSGSFSFSGLGIAKYGSYKIKAVGTDLTTGYSSTFTVLDFTTITLASTSTSYSENCDFTVTATLKDQLGGTWTQSLSLLLSGSNVQPSSALNPTVTGSHSFTIYCTSYGTLTLTASSGTISATLTLTILQNRLKFDSVSPVVIFKQPTLVTSSFDVQVGVYDNAGSTRVTRGSYGVITLSLDVVSGTMTGTLTGTSASGVLSLSSLMITTYGTYVIKATCSNLLEGQYTSLVIKDLVYVSLSSTSTSYSAYFDFTVTAALTDQVPATWTQSSTITISGSNAVFSPSAAQTTNSGSVSWTVYCTTSGSLALSATNGVRTGTLTITINKLQLKFDSLTPVVRYK